MSNVDLLTQVWGLGNIAGDSAAMRDRVLFCNAVQMLLPVLDRGFSSIHISAG